MPHHFPRDDSGKCKLLLRHGEECRKSGQKGVSAVGLLFLDRLLGALNKSMVIGGREKMPLNSWVVRDEAEIKAPGCEELLFVVLGATSGAL